MSWPLNESETSASSLPVAYCLREIKHAEPELLRWCFDVAPNVGILGLAEVDGAMTRSNCAFAGIVDNAERFYTFRTILLHS